MRIIFLSILSLFVLNASLYAQAEIQAKEKLTKESLHRQAIQEKLTTTLDQRTQAFEKELIQELYGVMDSFIAKDLEGLAKRIHPRMIEFDAMSPYRDIGKASFLEHMVHFFESPQHIEDHFVRIKQPLVQTYGDNVAVVSFLYDTEASVGGRFVQNYGKASFVFVKDKTLSPEFTKNWLLAVCHYTTLQPSLR